MNLDNFNDFMMDYLLENNKINNLPFVISERLFNLLKVINHPIADDIIKLHNKKEEKNVTFIDYDDETFSPEVDKETIFRRFTILNSNKAYDNISKEFNIELDKIQTFMKTTGPVNIGYGGTGWYNKSRSVIKIGSFIKKIFGDKFKDAGDNGNDITSFVNLVASKRKRLEIGNGGFELVKGDDIVYWYNEENYSRGGTLNASCMRYSGCSDFIEFYAKNSNNVSLLILKDPLDDEKIIGRAIVWKLHQIGTTLIDKDEPRYFMDRIYCTSDRYLDDFITYATENKWLYKQRQNYEFFEYIIDSNNGTSQKRSLYVKCIPNDYYPFMDTLRFYSEDLGIITNNEDNFDSEFYELTDVSGGYTVRNSGIYVEYYGEYYDEDDLQWCEYGDDWRLLDDCVRLGEYYDYAYATNEYVKNYLVWCNYQDEYYNVDDCFWSNYDNSYIHNDQSLEFIKNADYDSFEEAYDDDNNRELRYEGNEGIPYEYDGDYYTFSYDENKKYFIRVQVGDRKAYKHKVWDKDKLIKKDGVIYYAGNQAELDNLTGQLRLFDNKNNNFNERK